MRQIFIDGMLGIGDNIMERPFIKELAKTHQVWLKTATPEIFCDIYNVYFVRSNTPLRTQHKNEKSSSIAFSSLAPEGIPSKRIFYGNAELQLPGGIFESARKQFGVQPCALDLPVFDMPDIPELQGKKIAVIRPTTERREWHNAARGPLNSHVDQATRILKERGYFCVSAADVDGVNEWISGDEPYADLKLHRGELRLTELFALIQNASVVVTGSGVVSQTALAYRTPMIFLGGGCGGSNHHSRITDPEIMDLSRCAFIYPDNYCMCQMMQHNCDKRISNLTEKITEWLNVQNL